jgi:hypothetical protein
MACRFFCFSLPPVFFDELIDNISPEILADTREDTCFEYHAFITRDNTSHQFEIASLITFHRHYADYATRAISHATFHD